MRTGMNGRGGGSGIEDSLLSLGLNPDAAKELVGFHVWLVIILGFVFGTVALVIGVGWAIYALRHKPDYSDAFAIVPIILGIYHVVNAFLVNRLRRTRRTQR